LRRLQGIIVAVVLLAAAVGATALFAQRTANASSGRNGGGPSNGERFVGYWIGIDPLDGGDSRRGITRNDDGTLSVIGRDTVFTLCDGTDRAIVTDDDAALVDSALASDNFIISCTNQQSTVHLKVRYDFIDRNVIRETTTSQDDNPVDQIIFHRVSEQ
jgi:hypothetical protein